MARVLLFSARALGDLVDVESYYTKRLYESSTVEVSSDEMNRTPTTTCDNIGAGSTRLCAGS
ncbi:hypothetical protein PtrM4_014440 [Pyrenophora tritici-repentis]|nr:hypothetical protein PtrM4_014440 [Pyrenophora tritici-repentis]